MEKGDVGTIADDFRHMKASHFGAGLLIGQVPLEALFKRHWRHHWRHRSDAIWGTVHAPLEVPLEAPFRRDLGGRSGTVTPFWHRSPVQNVVQALEEDCSSQRRHPGVVLEPLRCRCRHHQPCTTATPPRGRLWCRFNVIFSLEHHSGIERGLLQLVVHSIFRSGVKRCR